MTAPIAERRPSKRIHHGDEFTDPYEWLRDKDDPAVIGYLEAENAFTEARTAHLRGLRDEIFGDITARTKQADLSVPSVVTHRPGASRQSDSETSYWYYQRTLQDAEYPVFCRAPATDPRAVPDTDAGLDGEQVLLDANAEASGSAFFALGAFDVSPAGDRLAYAVDLTGDERFELRVKDLSTGDLLPDRIDDVAYGVAWAGDHHLCYTRADDAWRPFQVCRHRLDSAPETDAVIFSEPDERFFVDVGVSRDEEWVVIDVGSTLTTEVWLLPTSTPETDPWLVAARRHGVEYEVEPAGDRLLILHNDGAQDFRLAETRIEATGPEHWRTVLEQQPGVRLLEVDAYAGQVVVGLRRHGLTGLRVLPRTGTGDLDEGFDIGFDEPVHTVESVPGDDYATELIRLWYSSLVTPPSTYDYDVAARQLILRKQTPVLDHPASGPFRPDDYVQCREWATAGDGTQVPISIVRRRDTALDGAAPAVLYGYGSYEASEDPIFSIPRLSLLDRGFVYAIAHVRGGGELGRSWYEQGKTTSKTNTFTDFIACARHLVDQGYTIPERLAARGGSAGGLLMGAVANLAPELFRAIHAAVPFVDPLTSILMPELPLTVTEWEEWGNPLHDPAIYSYMKSYSPYENVRAGSYPAILATTSLQDTRVLFTEPAKWVAALRRQATNTGDRPILLKTEMSAGHGGVSGRYQSWRETAFEYAWIIDQVAPQE